MRERGRDSVRIEESTGGAPIGRRFFATLSMGGGTRIPPPLSPSPSGYSAFSRRLAA